MQTPIRKKLVSQYADLFKIFRSYWTAYGGWYDLLTSPYLHIALLVSWLCSGYWLSSSWYGNALSILPNLLGFGISGFAIWIGWGDEKLRNILLNLPANEDASAYEQVSSIFAHFGLVQAAALIAAVLYSALDYEPTPTSTISYMLARIGLANDAFHYLQPIGAGIGFFLFIYALVTALEATFALFRLATWFQKLATHKNSTPPDKSANKLD